MSSIGLGVSRWQVHAAHRKTMRSVIVMLLMLAAVQFVAWVIPVTPGAMGVDNYLTLHALMEGFSIIVAMVVFAVGWNSPTGKTSGNLVLLACLFFAVGCLDFSHTEAYGGMPDFFTPNSPDKHLNFWIAARLLAASALLLVALRPWEREFQNKSKYALLISLIVGVIAFNWVVIYYQDALPDLFVPGLGLTALKKNLEYLCIGINLATMALLWNKMRTDLTFNAPLLFAAAAVMAMSEFYFTLYTTMTGAYNVLGHIYKVISYLLIYRAVVVESIERPYVQIEQAGVKLNIAVESLEHARASLKNTLDALPSLVGYWDEKLINKFANRAYIDYFDKEPEQILGMHISSVLGEDLYQKNLPFLQAALRGEEQNFDCAIPSPDGKSTKYTKAKYLPDITDGKVHGFYVFVFDVSDLRLSLEQLSSATGELQIGKSRMELATQSGGIGVWVFDVEHNTLQWDDRMYSLYGLTKRPNLEPYTAWSESVHPDDRATAEEVLNEALEGRREFDNEFRIIWPDQSVHHIHGTARVERDQNGKPMRMVGVNFDITDQKNQASALAAAKNLAEQLVQSKSQFLANMSHEIRTPMNAILGMLNLLQSTELTSRQRDYAGKTEGAAQSLLGLLNDILDFSKVEAGKMTLESEPFRIDNLMRNLSVVLSANMGAKNIEVLFDIDPGLPPVLGGDAMRLQQVLINLGGNAVKFTSTGQVVISLRKLAQTEHSVTIEFAVKDTGIGIAPEHQEHIFSGFSQAEGSTTRRFGGTGLGLAISKRFVELMGGDIHITSKECVGSTFAFTLELPTVDASTERIAATLPRRVLVVDDNPVAAELTLRMVRSWGWSAELAQSGKEAVELVSDLCATATAEFPYPVIYMDWKMPEMDGWEATRQIRELAVRHQLPQPTVIMLTAHGRDMLSHRTEAEQEQINGFLIKPATASMLYEAWVEAQSGNAGIRKFTKGRSSTRQLTGMRVLVVEDNLINQQVAEELLSSEGAIVSLAANGQLGVDAVAAAAPQFDVVLMDVQMPVLDGYGATRAIREELQLKDLPIIAMTANAMASDRDACMAAGMNEHIGKPFDLAKLVSVLIRMTGFYADAKSSDMPDASSTSTSTSASPAPSLSVPAVAGLDIQTALDRMSGMRSLYVRTAKDFVKIMDTAVPELHHCLKTGDKQQAMMRLHTLKGNAGTLGAPAMAAQAAMLEKMCTTNAGMAECEAALEQFEVLMRDTQDKVHQAIALLGADGATHTSAAVGMASEAPVSDPALQALHNIDTLTKAGNLEVLLDFAHSRELLGEFPLETMDALEEALQNLDLETASTICDQMLLKVNG